MLQERPSRSGSNGSSAFSELADEDGPPGPASPAAGSRVRDTVAREKGGSGYGIMESVKEEIRSTSSQHWENEEESTELSTALQALQACIEQHDKKTLQPSAKREAQA